jgi:hypothetical protein
MLKRQGFIEAWHDRRIVVGEELAQTIDANLEAADLILLLVSPDFLASEYCYDREMKRAMERHDAGQAVVIPVILRPCDWRDAPFGKLLAAPKDSKAVTQWPDLDTAFLDIVNSIKGALRKRESKPRAGLGIQKPPVIDVDMEHRVIPRSSNLRVAKEFTDRDKEGFLHETFEYIAKFFENSLVELSQRNSNVDGQFRRIDANRFTAVAYRDGKAISRCGIFVGGHGRGLGDIGYSNDDSATTNSYNESLTVQNDNQTLYLQPLGLSRFGRGERPEKLTPEGAAELFWELFIGPLQ